MYFKCFLSWQPYSAHLQQRDTGSFMQLPIFNSTFSKGLKEKYINRALREHCCFKCFRKEQRSSC